MTPALLPFHRSAECSRVSPLIPPPLVASNVESNPISRRQNWRRTEPTNATLWRGVATHWFGPAPRWKHQELNQERR